MKRVKGLWQTREAGLCSEVGASMWRADGSLANALTRPKRFGFEVGKVQGKAVVEELGEWED